MRVENGELRVKSKMSGMNVKTLIIPLFLVLFCCVFGCRNKQHSTTDESARDLPQIKDSGELVVLTLYSSTSYFIYRGQEMGFQYELSEQFAKSLGLKLRIEVAKSVDEMIQKLLAGEGDMIAYNLPITKEWKDSLLYCGEDVITHQVIVQQGRGKQKPLKDVTELVGKDIYVKPGKYYDRLVNLNSELGGGIRIHEVTNDSTTIEDLITQVAQGKIPYTVADNDLAKLNKTYYPNLNNSAKIAFLYDNTKFFTSCLLSFTINLRPVVRVITVSGVESTTSINSGFSPNTVPLSLVNSIMPFPLKPAYSAPPTGKAEPPSYNYLLRLMSSSRSVSETVIILEFA